MADFDEGADIPWLNGLLTPEHADRVNKHQLIDGKEYTCQHCYKTYKAPFVYRCICGCRCCENCSADHESGY